MTTRIYAAGSLLRMATTQVPAIVSPRTVVEGRLPDTTQLAGRQRVAVQRALRRYVDEVNGAAGLWRASRMRIRDGDGVQVVLRRVEGLGELLWLAEVILGRGRLQVGVGIGSLDVDEGTDPREMSGPAFLRAKQALMKARSQRLDGAVFSGFGPWDEVLTGLAVLLSQRRQELTARQWEVLQLLKAHDTQRAVAQALGVSAPTISIQARAIGWRAYEVGEARWSARFTKPPTPSRSRRRDVRRCATRCRVLRAPAPTPPSRLRAG